MARLTKVMFPQTYQEVLRLAVATKIPAGTKFRIDPEIFVPAGQEEELLMLQKNVVVVGTMYHPKSTQRFAANISVDSKEFFVVKSFEVDPPKMEALPGETLNVIRMSA